MSRTSMLAARPTNTLLARTLLGALALSLSACSGLLIDPPRPVAFKPFVPPAAPPAPAPPVPEVAQAILRLPPHLDPSSDLYRQRSVYFDFDEATLRPRGQGLVEAHGSYLSRYPELHVRIEGFTDDRGGREYNLALGERRAEAVKSALRLMGVRDEQVETVSFGEEKPRAAGTAESARTQNRRADVVYQAASK